MISMFTRTILRPFAVPASTLALAAVATGMMPVAQAAEGDPVLALSAPSSIAGPYLIAPIDVTVDGDPVGNYDVRIESATSPDGPWTESALGNQKIGATSSGVRYFRARMDLIGGPDPATYSPTATVSVGSRAVPGWLKQLNVFRTQYGSLPAYENPAMTGALLKHLKYMQRNNTDTGYEIKGKPGYTKAGAEAGQSAILIKNVKPAAAIKKLMNQPFHSMAILESYANEASFASFKGYAGVVPQFNMYEVELQHQPATPYHLPASGGTALSRSFGEERPNPLNPCGAKWMAQDKKASVGSPIVVAFGAGRRAPGRVTATLVSGGKKIPVCAVTEANYRNKSKLDQQWAVRTMRNTSHAFALIPLLPLKPGTAKVSVRAGGGSYSWSFKVR